MNDHSELRTRAKLTAQRYFEDYEDWPTPVLIGELETLAYQIAREGDTREATGLFVLVAELSFACAEHCHSKDGTRFPAALNRTLGGKHES